MVGFSFDEYRRILRSIIANGYRIVSASRGKDLFDDGKDRFCVLTHVVEVSIPKAQQIARIEMEFDFLSSTWLFIVNNPIYNLFSDVSREFINCLVFGENEIGLVFNSHDFGYDNIIIKKCLVEQCFCTKINALLVPNHLKIDFSREGGEFCVNDYPFENEIFCFSDKKGGWDFGNPLKSYQIKNGMPIHIQIRPIWWNDQPYHSVFDIIGEIEKFFRIEGGVYLKDRILKL